ncbi:hypothetical protein DM02DRAFT_232942 [Periconia macrospinosa]|uniref:Uncharacterized protein n=1 Tax=Periconia macrospinosa TaxID=97972 RepID=A0A2V1EB84_9PLEO|nr:hypothetical protein DM02DRAFT_232942 [Periconia macrospinosa]
MGDTTGGRLHQPFFLVVTCTIHTYIYVLCVFVRAGAGAGARLLGGMISSEGYIVLAMLLHIVSPSPLLRHWICCMWYASGRMWAIVKVRAALLNRVLARARRT